MPRVSAIIPVFNAERTLAEAIESVLAQTFRDFEIIAIDDGSSDLSLSVLNRYRDSVRVLQQKNLGPSAARNRAIAETQGELLAFLDADDRWRPQMLEHMVRALDSSPNAAMVYCDIAVIDSDGNPLMTGLATHPRPPTLEDMLDQLWPIMPSGVIVRRSALNAAGGWPEALTSFEDVYLWLRLREEGEFIHVSEELAEWRFAHFPRSLKRVGGQDQAALVFKRLVHERWKRSGSAHVLARRRAPRSILGYIGLQALMHGDRERARNAFAETIRIDPFRMKNYFRYLRTFLPGVAVRALSGRSKAIKS